MDFTNIFKMQKELDQAIISRDDLDAITDEEWQAKWLLAVLVEFSEFANEIQSFKYWKKHKNINHDAALEEFADVLHFLGSYAYKVGVNPIIEPKIVSKFPTDQILEIFRIASINKGNISKEIISELLSLSLGCAKLLNYTEEDIFKWYEIKNKKNFDRIKNHY
ncbi:MULTISPECIES: dUTP diphosphatase [unclassified Mycoplasma]|uniref:dUTP diphosphatase n=1 Tax=unclassified Mycoplasma TaxID=2683645 RepID=UPI00216B4A40|nr:MULTISPECIES: dUTP diphosphatase [unclassified Mycoplasma]MCS4537019.1 dUTP diphosphatase [Mycoplasma sp. CSL7475-4]MCT4469390.1 dUTP diphosphatase [Mycoplasma sp. HS2188]